MSTAGIVRTDTVLNPDALSGMPSFDITAERSSAHDPVRAAIYEFAGRVAHVMEHEYEKESGIKAAAVEIMEELRRTAPQRPHPTAKLALGGCVALFLALLSVVYGYGQLTSRVGAHDQAQAQIQADVAALHKTVDDLDHRTQGIEVLAEEIRGLRRDIERMERGKR